MKTATDLHWNERALSVKDDVEVNLMDIFQRDLEYEHVSRHLRGDMTVLEVGCGNGYSTNVFRDLVKHVDAFDYAENMIERAKATYGETNNRFIHDDVLELRHITGPYDAVVCIRVLINLRDLAAQRQALRKLTGVVRRGGLLILAEGFKEGFRGLDELRARVGLPPITPASINVYSEVDEVLGDIPSTFTLTGTFHLGMYDYLTRVFYPLLAGPENVRHNTNFSERAQVLARAFDADEFARVSRMRGFIFRRDG